MATRTGYGTVAISADAWINERAQGILTAGLPALPLLPGETRRFDPSQPRDEHGRWSLVGAVLHLAAGTLRLQHHGESGDVSIHDEHGGSLHLTRNDLRYGSRTRSSGPFREFANEAPLSMEHVGDRELFRHHETRDGKPFTVTRAGLHKTHVESNESGFDAHGLEPYQRDEHTLHLPSGGAAEDPDELFVRPGTKITSKELEDLAETLRDFSIAQDRLDTGHGTVMMTSMGGENTIDPHHRNQPPIVLNRTETKKAIAALNAARYPWDEYEHRDPLPAGEKFKRVIPIKAGGELVITRLGPDGDFHFESDFTDVRISPDKLDDFLEHLQFVVDADLKHLKPDNGRRFDRTSG